MESTVRKTERFSDLFSTLVGFTKAVGNVSQTRPELVAGRPFDAFTVLCLPWLLEHDMPQISGELRLQIESRKPQILEAGFDGEPFARELAHIRANDKQLAECCPNLALMANHFSRHFIHDAVRILNGETADTVLNSLYENFAKMTYEHGPFSRAAVTHIFNLQIEGNSMEIGSYKLLTIFDDNLIRQILGETGFRTFMHPPAVGNCFLHVQEGPGEVNDDQWLAQKHIEACKFAMLLQYFKDGVVHVGYTVPAYTPQWAHDLRREGLYFFGDPRRMAYKGGTSPYTITQQELPAISRYAQAMQLPKVAQAIDDSSSKLRQSILRAADYYEKSHKEPSAPERLVYLAIALESLFSPENKEQLRFRISQLAAQFLGRTAEEKYEIFTDAQRLYKLRSELVHGSYDVNKYLSGTFVTEEELARWSSLIRRSILGFFVLALRGEISREPILAKLEKAAFQSSIGEQLRNDANIERYLDMLLSEA
jgi:hypothetical protein